MWYTKTYLKKLYFHKTYEHLDAKKKVFMCIVSHNKNIGITLDVQIYKRKMFSNYILKHPWHY
jgi:hypothetical protein